MFTSPRVHETRGNSTHGVWSNRQTPNITPLSLISSTNDAGLASLLSVITRRCLVRPLFCRPVYYGPQIVLGRRQCRYPLTYCLSCWLWLLVGRTSQLTYPVSTYLYRTPLPLLVTLVCVKHGSSSVVYSQCTYCICMTPTTGRVIVHVVSLNRS